MKKTFIQLEKHYTNIVNDYIKSHPNARIDINAMNGSQGELTKIAFVEDNITTMIYLKKKIIKADEVLDYVDCVKIRIEVGESPKEYDVFWLQDEKHTIIFEETWYQIDDYSRFNGFYSNDIEDVRERRAIRHARYEVRENKAYKAVKYNTDTIIKIVKAKTGRKRVNAENIVAVYKRTNTNIWKIVTVFNAKEGNLFIKNRREV